jgi:N6-adenosine-specific RNA methylase IME4
MKKRRESEADAVLELNERLDAAQNAAILARTPHLIIDPEFHALIPAPRLTEFNKLERKLVREGCRDKLVVWRTPKGDILLDGHHRYLICLERTFIYEVHVLEFASRDDAKRWINENQVGRRNLKNTAFDYHLGKAYEARKRQGARKDLTSAQSDQKSTAEEIAREEGVSPATVRRAADFYRAINKIGEIAGADVKRQILSEEIRLNRSDVVNLAAYPDVAREEFGRINVTGGQVREALRDKKRREKYARIEKHGQPTHGEEWGRFTVLYADPPWAYEDERHNAASDSFRTMTVEQLIGLFRERLKLDDHLTSDCVLFLWATNPNLPAAFELLEGWGFKYRAHMIWEKPRPNLGMWVRGQHELLFIATRGNMPTPLESTLPVSIFEGAPWSRKHSAKPNRAYSLRDQPD